MSAEALHRVEPARTTHEVKEDTESARVPLSVVQYVPRKRMWRFLVVCVVVISATVAVALGVNVKVARGQYELVQLRKEQQQLVQGNEARSVELYNKKAPQNLAREAEKLGMVATGTAATINVKDQKIHGKATAATEPKDNPKASLLVDVPLDPAREERALEEYQRARVSTPHDTKVPAEQHDAAEKLTGAAGFTPSGTTGTQNTKVTDTPAKKTSPKEASGDNKKKAEGRPDFSGQELSGGSIPGPQTQRD